MTLYAQQDDEGRLVIGPEKANSTAAAAAAVFGIEAVQYFEPTLDDDGTVGRRSFDETSDRTARQHLIDKHEADQGEDQQARTTAVEWLEEYLEEEGPDANSADAKKSAAKAGISERTLQRARADLKVVWRRSGFGSNSVTTWSLPSQIPATGRATPKPPITAMTPRPTTATMPSPYLVARLAQLA